MKILLIVALALPLAVFTGARIYKGIDLNRNCTGYLKRAADANTVELARQELEKAVTYAEKTGLTNGYTSIVYRTPSDDVGFWYSNLKASLEEIRSVKPDATQLEKSNLLIKLRETLLDHGSEGAKITEPQGISVFPNNKLFAVLGALSALVFVLGSVIVANKYSSSVNLVEVMIVIAIVGLLASVALGAM